MRTIHIDTERNWRGGQQQALYLCRGLARRGVDVVAVGQPGSPFSLRLREEGFDVREIRMRGEGDPAAIAGIMGVIRRVRPSIVHLHTSHAHTLGVLACRAAGYGRTIVSRRVAFSIHRSPLRLNLLKYRFCVSRYIAVSEGVRTVLVEDGVPAARIEVVPDGVDLSEVRAVAVRDYAAEFGIPAGAPVVGNVAHFGWDKAQEELVRACPRMFAARPDLRVILVGDGRRREHVEGIARDLGLDGRLVFTGYRDDARALIRWFDVFVMCSVMEGLCTSILDAHALGTPVVASRVGGIPEIVIDGETGITIPPRDPDALAAAILSLLDDPGRAGRLAEAGGRLVSGRYTVDTMVDGTLQVYRRVLAEAA